MERVTIWISTQLTELAEWLLNTRYPSLQGTAEGTRLLPGELPADLPLPPNSRLVGSFVGPSGGPRPGMPATGRIVQVVINAPIGPAEALAHYQETMAEQGWRTPPEEAHVHRGGFSSFSGIRRANPFAEDRVDRF